jgi:hypothetical protein
MEPIRHPAICNLASVLDQVEHTLEALTGRSHDSPRVPDCATFWRNTPWAVGLRQMLPMQTKVTANTGWLTGLPEPPQSAAAPA